jgi:EamA domain-containing membrane protein RarD
VRGCRVNGLIKNKVQKLIIAILTAVGFCLMKLLTLGIDVLKTINVIMNRIIFSVFLLITSVKPVKYRNNPHIIAQHRQQASQIRGTNPCLP